jgi:hypothetical protein
MKASWFSLVLLTAATAFAQTTPVLVISRFPDALPAPAKADDKDYEKLLTRVFGPHLKSREACPNDATAAHQFAPSVVSQLKGRFTFPIAETLYIMSVGECLDEPYDMKKVVVVRDKSQEIVVNAPYLSDMADRVVNLDQDGVDEWVGVTSACASGACIENAQLMRIQDGKPFVLQDFGTIYRNTCCAKDGSGRYSWSSVVWKDKYFYKVSDSRACTCYEQPR